MCFHILYGERKKGIHTLQTSRETLHNGEDKTDLNYTKHEEKKIIKYY